MDLKELAMKAFSLILSAALLSFSAPWVHATDSSAHNAENKIHQQTGKAQSTYHQEAGKAESQAKKQKKKAHKTGQKAGEDINSSANDVKADIHKKTE